MKVAATGFGGLFGVGLLWMFGSLGGFGWWLFLVALSSAAAYVWAFLMWFVYKNVYEIGDPQAAEQERGRKS